MSNAHQKSDDPMRAYHLSQKKALEINPRHPLIKGKTKILISSQTHRFGFVLEQMSKYFRFSLLDSIA